MSASRVLAVAASSVRSADGVEFLRCLASLVATGHSVDLRETRAGLLSSTGLGTDEERYLDGLDSFGVKPGPVDAAGARSALRAARAILRLGASDRPGEPAVLVVDDALLEDPSVPDERLFRLLLDAGQVVRV